MKKRIAMATMAIMALFTVSAFAQGWGIGADPSTMPAPGYGRGHGHGMHYMNGGYPCWGTNGVTPPAIVVNNEADAKKVVTDFVNANFKGYKVNDVAAFNSYRGQTYFVYATDASGNSFTFVTGAYGGVRGPMPGKIAPTTIVP